MDPPGWAGSPGACPTLCLDPSGSKPSAHGCWSLAGSAQLLWHPRLAGLGRAGQCDTGGATATSLLRHLGSASELPSHAYGAVLGQGTADPSLCITAPWGQTLAWFVSLLEALVHICYPQPCSWRWQEGTGRDGSGPTVFCPSLLLSRGSPQASGSPGPKLGPSPGQTPYGKLKSWICVEEGAGGLCLPSPTAGTLLVLLEVWQHRRDRNWSCKSCSSGGAPVATAVLRGQEGAEELVCNGELQAVSSYEVANGERKESKALQEGRKEKAGERKGGEGAKQRKRSCRKGKWSLRAFSCG